MSAPLRPFHLAFPVNDLPAARHFYGSVLGCVEGRSAEQWIDFDFFGHQIVTHLVSNASNCAASNPVDGHAVPIPHFGIVLTMAQFDELAARLQAADVDFDILPHTRFVGQPGEQSTMFFRDPAGNALEFKAFANDSMLFERS